MVLEARLRATIDVAQRIEVTWYLCTVLAVPPDGYLTQQQRARIAIRKAAMHSFGSVFFRASVNSLLGLWPLAIVYANKKHRVSAISTAKRFPRARVQRRRRRTPVRARCFKAL